MCGQAQTGDPAAARRVTARSAYRLLLPKLRGSLFSRSEIRPSTFLIVPTRPASPFSFLLAGQTLTSFLPISSRIPLSHAARHRAGVTCPGAWI
jgi:hypothetical protein